jgi:small subunit ribosomal protein S1
MEQMGTWIPGSAPPDEMYWEALLHDAEEQGETPKIDWAPWIEGGFDGPDPPAPVGPVVHEDPWEDARGAMERGEVLELPVVGCNRGGVLVQWNGLHGFVPASHLVSLSPSTDKTERRAELEQLIGTRLSLKIIELESEQQRFVLSERASRHDEYGRQESMDSLLPGDIHQGRVTNLCSFGAFVDLGGVEGLVHVSEISWGRVDHPGDVLKRGQEVEVYVINVDRERGRVGLSIRRLKPNPWQLVEENYHVGQVVKGVITHVVDFGAFARVEEGLEGLIHISELDEENVLHPRDVVQEGDIVNVHILSIDGEHRRMGLSLRQP